MRHSCGTACVALGRLSSVEIHRLQYVLQCGFEQVDMDQPVRTCMGNQTRVFIGLVR